MNIKMHMSKGNARESFGPFRRYLLANGLLLKIDGKGAVVSDGAGSEVAFSMNAEPNEFGLYTTSEYARLVDKVQSEVGARFVGFHGVPSDDAAFRVDEHAISAGWLSETLLGSLLTLEFLVRQRILNKCRIDEANLASGVETVWEFDEEISYGKIGPSGLEQAINLHGKDGVPMKEAFFIVHGKNISEDMRNALLAACFHFHSLNSRLRTINESGPTNPVMFSPNNVPWETIDRSKESDELSYAFTGCVVASYTALDLLYALFVYLTREQFLNPKYPSGLHFSDVNQGKVFRKGGAALPSDATASELPFAIPNLSSDIFASLRKSRNDLVHNMGTDAIRPRVLKGWKLPRVNHHPLQCVRYLSRDIDAAGEPVTHDWVRRFYEKSV